MNSNQYEVGTLKDANKFAIILMALEAGLVKPSHPYNPWSASQEELERFYKLAFEDGVMSQASKLGDEVSVPDELA